MPTVTPVAQMRFTRRRVPSLWCSLDEDHLHREMVVWIMATGRRHRRLLPAITGSKVEMRHLGQTGTDTLNSLAPGKFEWNFRYLIFQIISVIDGWVISCQLALRRISLDFTDGKSTLVQVMAWCHHATSHYLSQCWPRSLSPYGVTRPQWVNVSWLFFLIKELIKDVP